MQAENETETEKILQPIIETIRDRFGNFIISEDNKTLEGVILAELAKTNSTLSTAEMHTSGAISARLNPKVGDLLLFPNYLMHTAYPFNIDAERRSFSFNVKILFKK